MSNLDDVIKDILGNMFYDRSKTITEQIAPNMRYRTPGSPNLNYQHQLQYLNYHYHNVYIHHFLGKSW